MTGILEPPVTPAWRRRGLPRTQTAYVAVAFAVLVVVIWILAPVFMTPRNLLNISKNFSFIALMSLGETLVIISGGIDLAVGSVCALSAVVTMMLMRFLSDTTAAQLPGATIALAVLLALTLAGLIGLVNGLLIARVRLSPFVTTLGMLSVARGMTYVLTQGRAQYPTGPDIALFTRFANGAVLGLPTPLLYLLVLAVMMGLALRHLVWGRHLYAVGGNAQAAALTGVRVPHVVVSVYVLSGLAGGFSGVLIAGWLGAAPAQSRDRVRAAGNRGRGDRRRQSRRRRGRRGRRGYRGGADRSDSQRLRADRRQHLLGGGLHRRNHHHRRAGRSASHSTRFLSDPSRLQQSGGGKP